MIYGFITNKWWFSLFFYFYDCLMIQSLSCFILYFRSQDLATAPESGSWSPPPLQGSSEIPRASAPVSSTSFRIPDESKPLRIVLDPNRFQMTFQHSLRILLRPFSLHFRVLFVTWIILMDSVQPQVILASAETPLRILPCVGWHF